MWRRGWTCDMLVPPAILLRARFPSLQLMPHVHVQFSSTPCINGAKAGLNSAGHGSRFSSADESQHILQRVVIDTSNSRGKSYLEEFFDWPATPTVTAGQAG